MRRYSRRGGFSELSLPYRSGLEDRIAEQLKNRGVPVVYERYQIAYIVPSQKHVYTPDFLLPNGIIVEAKGLFDSDDRRKHLLLQKQHPNLDVRFIFSNTKTKIYKGSKTTVADWCDKHGFKYACREIPTAWFLEAPKPHGLNKKGGD